MPRRTSGSSPVSRAQRRYDEFPRLIEWAHGRGMDLTLIEVMPLGETGPNEPLSLVRGRLRERYQLNDIDDRTGGPARDVRVAAAGWLHHADDAESCNRVRVACTGTFYMCLGQQDAANLRKPGYRRR
jgi:cyclic pyranopterin phosphate synthase